MAQKFVRFAAVGRSLQIPRLFPMTSPVRFSTELGSGAGKGGGGGGTIREAGGSLGKMAAAHEEQYFRELQAIQLRKLKEHLLQQIRHHDDEIELHLAAIKRHEARKKDFNDLLRESLSYPSLT